MNNRTYFCRPKSVYFYRPQRGCEGYVFTASVCPHGVGVSASVHAGIPPSPGVDTPPEQIPQEQTPPRADNHREQTSPGSRHHPPPPPPSRSRNPTNYFFAFFGIVFAFFFFFSFFCIFKLPLPPPVDTGDGHCCGRYASYWNAFLFKIYSRLLYL